MARGEPGQGQMQPDLVHLRPCLQSLREEIDGQTPLAMPAIKLAGMGQKDRMKFAQQMGQAGMMGMTPRFKVKQRSHRLTKKEREKLKKKKRRR